MDVKDIEKRDIMTNKRKIKAEIGETKKMKVEDYCVLCQLYGHILSKECVAMAICFHCGSDGHVRRDCKEKRDDLELTNEIKFEKIKQESSYSEKEYVEEDIPKDEHNNEVKLESHKKDMVTPFNLNKEYIEEDLDDKKTIEVEAYCILCQMAGHIFSGACVTNVTCLACGDKGHVRRDCKEEKDKLRNAKIDGKKGVKEEVKKEFKEESIKYEKEYVEVEINKREPKTEASLKCNREVTEGIDMITSLTEENNENNSSNEVGEICGLAHSLKKCTVNLLKVNIKQYEEVSSKSGKQAKHEGNYKSKYKHMQAQHQGVRHECNKCSYQSKYKVSLTRHMKAEHEGVSYACQKCSYKAKYKESLTRHMEAQHQGVRYNCQTCNFQSKYKDNLTKHIQAQHEGVSYDCQKCSYKAKYKESLRRHLNAEHEGVSYACQKCSFLTKCKAHLTKHMKAEHEGVIYSCQICNFQSKYGHNLARHMQAAH